jgi:hypothetical protein
LFSTFAHGPPGAGLLLMRLAGGIALLVDAATTLRGGPPIGAAVLPAISTVLAAVLLVGLWTPIAGVLVLADALWNLFASDHPCCWILVGTLGAALALLGPGVWSVDSRLFGWKRLDLRPQKKGPPPSP